jgi:AraC-like DNA-binding protein
MPLMDLNDSQGSNYISRYQENFEKLQVIAYKDLVINGLCLRILGIHYLEMTPDWSVKNHRHSFFEFHYVADGYTYTTIHHVERWIKAGSFYLMPPGTYHSHRQDPEGGHIGFALRWEFVKEDVKSESRGSSLELERMGDCLFNASTLPVEDEGKILYRMVDLLELTDQEGGIIPLQLAFCRLLFHIAGFYNIDKLVPNLNVNQNFLENQIVRGAINFIEENYSEEIDVKDVSSTVHLSYSHLSRLFKKHTGETINYHLSKVRLGKAAKLLMCSDKTLAQISREVGIGNEHYFCTLFKKFHGISPGIYRNSRERLFE